jgi:REP element-mobilizing transposase RayT
VETPSDSRRRPHRLHPELYRCGEIVFSITIGTSPREAVFADALLATGCRDLLLDLAAAAEVPLYAYCLMPDHVHLVLSASLSRSVPEMVGTWKSLCFRIGRGLGHRASFWQRGFWDHALRTEAAVHGHCLYVLHNPVRAGLVTEWRLYPWCGSEVFRF